MNTPPIVSPEEWQAAREQLLVKEKELTRASDAVAAERRRMPWLAVEKQYEFEGPTGTASLLDLFEGRRQLIVYRAFFEPGVYGWPEHACRGCSMVADQVAHVAHLNARDTTQVVRDTVYKALQMGKDGATHQDGDLLNDLDTGVPSLPGLLAAADGTKEGKKGRDTKGRGHDCKGSGCCVSHVFIDMIDIRAHSADHSGETSGLGKIGNNFTTFNTSIVVLVNEQRLDDDQNLMHVWANQVIQLVEYPIDDLY